MREQLRSDMTVEKFKLLADHYNGTFSSNPIFQDYLKNHRFGDTYSDIEMRYFIDEFEYVKTMRDLLGYQDKTLGIFYGRTLLDACRNKNIYTIAKKDSK